MPRVTNLEGLRPPGHLFELNVLRANARAAFADGEEYGLRTGWKQGVRWGMCCGACIGSIIGVAVHYFLGPLL